jgi:hypothetical protein
MFEIMTAIARECLKHPGSKSVWSPQLKGYVCAASEEGKKLAAEAESDQQKAGTPPARPTINPQFKLVFLTAAGGTLLFVVLCLVLTLIAGKTPPPLFEKVVMGFFDLAKIGFGAVVGLLGGKTLGANKQPEPETSHPAQHNPG